MDPNDQRFFRLILKEFEKGRIRNRFDFLDRASVDRRACGVVLWYLQRYQPVQSLARVLAKISDVPIDSRTCFSVGDVADYFIEVSFDGKRSNFALSSFVKTAPNCVGIGK